jgi:hypothetical protein
MTPEGGVLQSHTSFLMEVVVCFSDFVLGWIITINDMIVIITTSKVAKAKNFFITIF